MGLGAQWELTSLIRRITEVREINFVHFIELRCVGSYFLNIDVKKVAKIIHKLPVRE